ncbi:hypothetical protein C1646_819200 [Rhizophagus diaphanus]|nr:hypothetical protein C1646_819200 [Rhizophagus diaphanus] [Rhizophagus sp. MUCL 43196]
MILKGKNNFISERFGSKVIRIFYFNLLIQEPVVHYHWFNNNEKINKSYMKGSWDEDEIENLVVEICSFPLILKPIYPNGFKGCTPAKVFPFHIMKQNLAKNLETSELKSSRIDITVIESIIGLYYLIIIGGYSDSDSFSK